MGIWSRIVNLFRPSREADFDVERVRISTRHHKALSGEVLNELKKVQSQASRQLLLAEEALRIAEETRKHIREER